MFSTETISKCISSCDERLNSVQKKINSINIYDTVLKIGSDCYDDEDDKKIFNMEDKYYKQLENYKNNIQLINVEKLIYNALLKNNSTIFIKLLDKYDTLLAKSYELGIEMMSNDEFMEYYNGSLKQREYISKLCIVGSKI